MWLGKYLYIILGSYLDIAQESQTMKGIYYQYMLIRNSIGRTTVHKNFKMHILMHC